ncbi:aldehyde dehydrogenase [Curtobacterium sp. MCBD17_034]|uniref:aldehyde dehydrogenase family protein n=1 Tax=unclassified Curtobacterium TaxID=257496 RepID=UPI000DA787ED|nr:MULTISPECIES: aldehyde dehydrogenase family protein [unclassified Curtobacterium]PZF60087.1 aldehyde dehydrogenase [Curtobacterium sp. MCBD17_034]PZM34772.1 aldehyde dehydrogenase [Curtobacterium sp. MCBD17_031]
MTTTPTTPAAATGADATAPRYAEALAAFWPDGRPRNFVGGRWTDAAAGAVTHDPSTGTAYTDVPETSRAEVDEAVAVALAAQPAWAARTVSDRAAVLGALRAALAEHGEALARLEAIDSGNPMPSTRRDVGLALRYLQEWPGIALAQAGRVTRPHADGISIVTSEPYGVVGKIIAYNHPSLFALAGLVFPLLAGNTIVIKAAAQTPVATLALGALLQDTVPPGVVNIVSGGVEAGDALVVHPRVKRIAFTGSDRTAVAIQSRLSESGTVKHFSAELGGKNPFVICADADLDEAAAAAFAGLSFTVSAGQSCQATARILVHESVHDAVVERMAARMDALRLGAAYDETTEMGPLVSAAQRDRVLDHVRSAVDEGARLVTGGHVVDRPGYFVEPTLFTDTTAAMRIGREEVFGPVAITQRFRDEAEAIALANEGALGLSAAVWTNDLDRALRLGSAIRAGYVWVNDANRHYPGSPFGGAGGSGVGREESVEEYRSYSESKALNIRVRPA